MIEMEIHPFQSALFEGFGHSVVFFFRAIEQEKAAAAGSGNLARGRPMLERDAIVFIDDARREVRSKTALLLPGIIEQPRKFIQVAFFETSLHIERHLLDV